MQISSTQVLEFILFLELEITKKKLIEKVVENAKFEGLITKLDQWTSMDNEDAVKTLPVMLYNSKTQKTLGKNKNGELIKEKPDSKVISRLNFLNGNIWI